jgi:hypothetical protein
MERAFYYSTANVVFLTTLDAQGYFNEIIYDRMDCYDELDEFLKAEGYCRAEIFRMDEREKEEVISDYKDYLFKAWLDEECCEVEVYADEM